MSLGGLGSIKRLEEDGRGIKRVMRVGIEEEKVVNSHGFSLTDWSCSLLCIGLVSVAV